MPSMPHRLLRSAAALVRVFGASRTAAPDRRAPSARADRRPVPRPPGMSAVEYEAYQLVALGEAGATHVRLRAAARGRLPAVCAETDGFTMTLEEAMLLRPIPHEVGPEEACRCSYRPATR